MRRHTDPSELAVRQRLHALTKSLPAAEKGDATRLHEARVATRRLREAVLLTASGPRARRVERTVRRLTRALGPVRELDVAMQTLDEIADTGGVAQAAIRALKDSIRDERHRLPADMRRQIKDVNIDKLRRRAIAGTRTHHARSSDAKGRAKARLRVAKRASRLQAKIDNAAGIYLPDRLHDVRVAIKKLRYAMEVVNQLSGSRAAASLRTLKAAQDLLGHMHDLEVLTMRVRAMQASSGPPNLKLSAELDRLVRRLEAECRQLHSEYIAMRKKLIAICDRTASIGSSRGDGSARSAA